MKRRDPTLQRWYADTASWKKQENKPDFGPWVRGDAGFTVSESRSAADYARRTMGGSPLVLPQRNRVAGLRAQIVRAQGVNEQLRHGVREESLPHVRPGFEKAFRLKPTRRRT